MKRSRSIWPVIPRTWPRSEYCQKVQVLGPKEGRSCASLQLAPPSVETSMRVTPRAPAKAMPAIVVASTESFAPSPGLLICDIVWTMPSSSQPCCCQNPLKSLATMLIPLSHLTFFIP